MNSILELEDRINTLKKEDKESYKAINGIFNVSSATGSMKIPSTYRKRILELFGKKDHDGNIIESEEEVVKRIETQKVVKTYNKWTGNGSLFNSLRAARPGMGEEEKADIRKKIDEYIKSSEKGCEFCYPEINTPEDVFGRVKGKFCITGSNIAKYDAWSSVIFFKRHNPLEFSLEEVSDYIDTGFKWFKKVYNHDKRFKYPFFLWNCLQKAGASQVHSHAQILMTDSIHYAKPQFLRKVFRQYMQLTGKNYFRDLYKAHNALELTLNGPLEGFASITPIKEKEFIIISRDDPSKNDNIKEAIYRVLRGYIDELGVTSFNMVISCPAFGESSFPYLIQIIDRGSIFKTTVDTGAMELYGSSVISDDPYNVIKSINEF
jgi:galactose-1-phosphate uridylyltransferase